VYFLHFKLQVLAGILNIHQNNSYFEAVIFCNVLSWRAESIIQFEFLIFNCSFEKKKLKKNKNNNNKETTTMPEGITTLGCSCRISLVLTYHPLNLLNELVQLPISELSIINFGDLMTKILSKPTHCIELGLCSLSWLFTGGKDILQFEQGTSQNRTSPLFKFRKVKEVVDMLQGQRSLTQVKIQDIKF
jgi:hypothetical protein